MEAGHVLLEQAIAQWDRIALWGFAATAVMSTILEGSQALGLSRLSLPFLVGTWFTSSRRAAAVIGYFSYLVGGWVFATSAHP
jgi:hypothetical protein